MTKDTMEKYGELEIYRGFSIMGSIAQKPTSWCISIRIGTHEDNNFVQQFISIYREFDRTEGAINCCMSMIEEAKAMIDRQAETSPTS
jgi:hypothetical protein